RRAARSSHGQRPRPLRAGSERRAGRRRAADRACALHRQRQCERGARRRLRAAAISSEPPMTVLDQPAATADAPVTLPFSVQFDVASEIAGRTYRVFVFQPLLPAPSTGYPVVTMSDGNMNFPMAMVMAAMFQQTAPALMVAVGYPTANPLELSALRCRDLTPPTPLENIIITPGQPPAIAENYGGGEAFLRFLTEELRPLIAARWS